MPEIKTETITLRIEPGVKAGLKAVAARERRSLANMIEVMIRDYCGRSGVSIPERPGAPQERSTSGKQCP